MRISKQISGNAVERDNASKQGRGEYEWCDLTDNDPSWATLHNRRIWLCLPGGIILDTGCILGEQGGKSRIRRAEDTSTRREIYPHYHLGAALMMPRTTRQEQSWGGGMPVLRNDQYSIVDIHCGQLDISEDEHGVYVDVERLTVRNQYRSEDITISERFAQVQRVWQQRGKLDSELAKLVEEHETLVRGGNVISNAAQPLVQNIQSLNAALSREYPEIAGASAVGDPLPTLLQMIGLAIAPPETPIDQIPPDQVEIRRREIKNQRLTAARGSSAARFRRHVREAYNSTCFVCGTTLPACGPGGSPGVDSCHILPYSQYDLDKISNGVCLCKLHHWTFDEGLIEICYDLTAGYSVVVPDEAVEIAEEAGLSVEWLRAQAGIVPTARLPKIAAHRPDPSYLAVLKTLLYPPD
jgi:putative restriction endonuclease